MPYSGQYSYGSEIQNMLLTDCIEKKLIRVGFKWGEILGSSTLKIEVGYGGQIKTDFKFLFIVRMGEAWVLKLCQN